MTRGDRIFRWVLLTLWFLLGGAVFLLFGAPGPVALGPIISLFTVWFALTFLMEVFKRRTREAMQREIWRRIIDRWEA
jgi:hypothetical protein